MFRRIMVSAVSIMLAVSSFSVLVSAEESGSCGDEVVWTLDDNGLLTVSGTGAINGYTFLDPAPWKNSDVKEVVIGDGVTSIGTYAFEGQAGLEKVTLSSTVTKIDIGAFQSIGDSFTEIIIPPSVTFIGQYALASNDNLVIKGYPGSYAEEYAGNNSFSFESLGEVPLNDVVVSTSEELENAIKSFNRIILKDGVYKIDHPLAIGTDNDKLTNITITAENPGKAEILSTLGYEPVVEIVNASQIALEGLILGHETVKYQEGCGSTAYSSGYVVYANMSDGVTISGCDLYGCGTVALVLENSNDFVAENSVFRDCKESIASIDGQNAVIKKCIISGNAYDPDYASAKAGIWIPEDTAEFTDSKFINNYSTAFWNGYGDLITNNCEFYNNAWDDEIPEEYGVCLNGITWQINDGILKLGYQIELDGGAVIESEKGEILPYSIYSLPWRGKSYSSVELAEGVYYNDESSGSCGENASWTLKNGVLTISGTGAVDNFNSVDKPEWESSKDIITDVVIDEGITKLGNMLFMDHKSLKSLKLPDSLETIGSNVFTGCGELKDVSFGKGLKEIGIAAFSACSISSADLPEGLVTLGVQAFSSCPLTEIKLPSTLENFSSDVFRGCSSLKTIEIEEGNAKFTIYNGVLYSKDMTSLIFAPPAKDDKIYVIPEGVTEICSYAFNDSMIGEIVVADSVKKIEMNAIYTGDGNVIFPDSDVMIEDYGVIVNGNGAMYVHEGSSAEEYVKNSNAYINYKIIRDLSKAEVYGDQNGSQVTIILQTDEYDNRLAPIYAICFKNGVVSDIGEIEYGYFEAQNVDSVKLFTWDSLDTMRPLTNAYTAFEKAGN